MQGGRKGRQQGQIHQQDVFKRRQCYPGTPQLRQFVHWMDAQCDECKCAQVWAAITQTFDESSMWLQGYHIDDPCPGGEKAAIMSRTRSTPSTGNGMISGAGSRTRPGTY